jgi:alkylation response protein AidB-like acyl-CoA dehydrogenase
VIEDCLHVALDYARERSQHGKAIGKHQLVQDHLARIEIARQSSESLLITAADAKARSLAAPADEKLYKRADVLAAEAKFFAANAAWEAADRALQVFGGRGYSDLYRPSRHLKDVRVCRIYEGTDEILKLKIAASLLGKEFEAFR